MEAGAAVDPLPEPRWRGEAVDCKHEAEEDMVHLPRQHPYFHSKGGAQGGGSSGTSSSLTSLHKLPKP